MQLGSGRGGAGRLARTIVGFSRRAANTTSKEYTGRPALPVLVREEAAKAADAQEILNVYVCGPATMQNDIRNAVAGENLRILGGAVGTVGVYLHSEHFSWA